MFGRTNRDALSSADSFCVSGELTGVDTKIGQFRWDLWALSRALIGYLIGIGDTGTITKLTAMRFARGMFRLWLVLSCLWIATVAAIGYSNWPSSTPPTEQATGKDSKAYDPKTYVPEYLKDENPNNAFADFAKPGTSRFAEAIKDFDAVKAQQSAQHLAISLAELAFVPPALFLLVGASLTWAFLGFRPT